MKPVSQIIWRNVSRFNPEQSLLLISPPADDLVARLLREGFTVDLLSQSWAVHSRLVASGLEGGFGLLPPRATAWRQLILFQPREKALLDMMLELCCSALEPNGRFWLAGENRAGIKSGGKRLADWFSEWAKVDSARHCALFEAGGPQQTSAFEVDPYSSSWTLEVAGRDLIMHSLPGVFAHGRLDAGSRLLIDTLATDSPKLAMSGRVLDFACGSGAIGMAIAAKYPEAQLTLLDDSALALESARRSLESNNIEARLIASDGLSELLREDTPPFDWIVSNPPFHQGVREDLQIAERFIQDCPGALEPGGRLCLVANAHLPYRRWLEELFSRVQVIAADREYNVWLAS